MTKLWQSASYQNSFSNRHIGPDQDEITSMLKALSYESLEELVDTAVPKDIQDKAPLDILPGIAEHEALQELRAMMSKNKVHRSLIGAGYYDCVTPSVISRNILENPAWYTQYTPYQAEIAQGRLEALLNFQTMVAELCGLDLANASLLDEGTGAAEAMNMSREIAAKGQSDKFFVSQHCHAQTIGVLKTRALALGIEVVVGDEFDFDFDEKPFGLLLQYPGSHGAVADYTDLVVKAKQAGVIVTFATDLLALASLKSPGELGADIAVGNSQRFGVPLGYGGPHAGFFATKDEFKRKIPGRIVGVTKDANGDKAYRLALQTREQHIRRDKATSNICTAQVLLAIMASMYGVFHGSAGVKKISSRVNALANLFGRGAKSIGFDLLTPNYFDTVAVVTDKAQADKVMTAALAAGYNLNRYNETTITIAFDEKSDLEEVEEVLSFFGDFKKSLKDLANDESGTIPDGLQRTSDFMTHEVFNRFHSETEMMRYIRKLEARDLSLTRSMIPLGSCTMKLNAASELMPITWPEVNGLHPFVPLDQAQGYQELFTQLENWLCKATGFDAVSLQPNSGAQGEFAGLMVIAKYHEAQGQGHRNVCLIPSSAHGTNPASAVLAGMKVVVIKCDDEGNIDLNDLQGKAEKHKDKLSALMITYPSTHGVFENDITRICDIIHENGGQVYMDGANLNAQIGLCQPGKYGPDVCHMNLHKTFCIPHGGGGPGVGPIGVRSHLAAYLPNHPVVTMGGKSGVGPISAAPWGSPSILPISWMYIRMMGGEELKKATQVAILNANYMAKRLEGAFSVVYRGNKGLVAHECIIDLKEVKKTAGITVDDIAKRLIDYGYHAPTVSWPVPNSMMIEPTESESKAELDRFCDAMISIREEIREIESGKADKDQNPLKHAPHTAAMIGSDAWDQAYSREQAAYPLPYVRDNKFWPFVARIDNAFGDRNLVCSCPPLEDYE
ncbi:aminomethyl-transferring glycine dehydrogenase [Pseudobacteriovorax antillogorgiicola]|uniref:Glycine dehydrogenase (decarboxylating) n=1 Tax=Pseudobacteriovorax antillogorgiicola TaxID=1513793 RepID=A0A1Y6B4H0_9BACT|nr:aminomethyl-transferring glycine dehydrogenase [Pseudobacteriovorax antillogorgiicola]TCS59125.1 glycine dehydrogenase (decarboxylating) alpha subunit /glycine dehydrogenase (decarboxylating) beta subunit [Pseudobacteriovorax antillogorgiicola]SME91508.1 glycine dehydrogenase (decarboxylating) alpha subunit /glycine dehydrogenase (decarboxylating) beta subunit [Pseudobacteriovorax antillogorgiicola]